MEWTKMANIGKEEEGEKKEKSSGNEDEGRGDKDKEKKILAKRPSRILANATCVLSCLNKEPLNVIKQQDRKLL